MRATCVTSAMQNADPSTRSKGAWLCLCIFRELFQLVFRDHISVEEAHFAIGVFGEAPIVGDQADGRPSPRRPVSRCITASPFFESRLPVGPSASRMAGEPARARATATTATTKTTTAAPAHTCGRHELI